MATASLVDYLYEKFYSFSSKMWGNSLQPSTPSFLMNGNANFQQYDLSVVLPEVRDKNNYQIMVHATNQFLPLHHFTSGIFGGHKQFYGMDKPNNFMNYMTEKNLFPHLFNFISDSQRSKYGPHDSSLISLDSKFLNPAKESSVIESRVMKTETMNKEKVCKPQLIEMSVDVSHLPTTEKSITEKKNCNISPTMRLNIELAHRKTKEISKRSKKRRRRQKKSEQLNVSSSSSSASDDDDANNECSFANNSTPFLRKSPNFGCALTVTHTVQLSSHDSFLIPVRSDSEDDSEWETFDEIEICASNNVSFSETDSNGSSPNSSPIKNESLKSSSFKPVDCSVHVSSIISFVVPEDDSNDDDSDWDTCETGTLTDNSGFELSGLYFNNLCTPHSFYKSECNSDYTSEADSKEKLKLRAVILEANNKWNKLDDGQISKSVSKVTFACDEDLVAIFPVENYERKGEWETYVTARDRFKRKVQELEKVILPCLTPEHRAKIFKKIVEPSL